MSTAAEATGLTVRVGAKALLADVTLGIETGRIVALAGPNGAGKSTLLRALAGDITPSAGRIRLAGQDPRAMSARELAMRRAILSQHVSVNFPFTAIEVVQMGTLGRTGAATDTAIASAVAEVDLVGFEDRIVGTLSGGEQQRVHLARVLVQLAVGEAAYGPAILMLDEPTASLDLRHQLAVAAAVGKRARNGTTAIIVLHDLNLAATFADQIVLLDRGAVAAFGKPHDVICEETFAAVFKVLGAVRTTPAGRPLVLPHDASVAG